MNKEAQMIAIAEACGWQKTNDRGLMWHPETCRGAIVPGSDLDVTRTKMDLNECRAKGRTPDYLNDLNAMHEAEKVLTPSERERYKVFLHEVSGSPIWGHGNVIHATAAQRAEAFLRTLNLWKDSP